MCSDVTVDLCMTAVLCVLAMPFKRSASPSILLTRKGPSIVVVH
jgi:hypothetical protein